MLEAGVRWVVAALVVALVFVNPAIARQPAPAGVAALDQVYTLAEFTFENGQALKNLRIGYDLYGKSIRT